MTRSLIHWLAFLVGCVSTLQAEDDLEPLPGSISIEARAITALDVQTQVSKRVFHAAEETVAITLVFVTNDCPIANYYSAEIRRIAATFQPQGIAFALVYSIPDLPPSAIRQHLDDYGHDTLSAYADPHQDIARAVGATVTPEAAVVLRDGTLAYRGRIDDLYADFGKRRRVVRETELRDALQAIVDKRPIAVRQKKAVGCYLPPL